MVIWEKGRVLQILEEEPHIQWLTVREERSGERKKAVHYPGFFGGLDPGDQVWLNTTAVRLQLGTGGVHFVAGRIGKDPAPAPVKGHMMKLRYTPWQVALPTGEEPGSPWHQTLQKKRSLEQTPVCIGELHSMLPIAATVWRSLSEDQYPRVVYVMTDGGALPAPFSRHVRRLTSLGWLAGTITCGHAFGGDMEAVNLYSALLLARHALNADLIFVSMGPGIAGTGTPYGFSGVEQGQAINAVHSLQGIPVAVPRIQGKDVRERHQGISHHTETVLCSVALAPAIIPLPSRLPEPIQDQVKQLKRNCLTTHHWVEVSITDQKVEEWLNAYPETIQTMGRKWKEDPLFFRTISVSAYLTFQLWRGIQNGRSVDRAIHEGL
ncbi:DUF3866 family protein [Melghirimyces algeriensis]|uniref:DUF3866 domain-containing protein n=1 Tax=Melghirimyces algeriensis TaxID=910412 RepID=A0A521B1B9_9BACL|nr:DUF3866 family protein [Melghirimyces algeriensis]SMO40846.1 Protein of unknown function [Melghirimyces algeriensis]